MGLPYRPLPFLQTLRSDDPAARRITTIWAALSILFIPSSLLTRLFEWTGMSVELGGAEVFVTFYLPMLFCTVCVFWLGYLWAAIPAYFSTVAVALAGGVPGAWIPLFALANPLSLGVYFMAYRAIPVRTDLRTPSAFAFFVLVAFSAALAGSAGSFVWGYTNDVGHAELLPVWQGWWLGGFLQAVLLNGVFLFLFSPRFETWKRKAGLGLDLGDMLSSKRLRLAFGIMIATLFGYVIMVRSFSALQLEDALLRANELSPAVRDQFSLAFEGLSFVHWVTLAIIAATGVLGYQALVFWTRELQASRNRLAGANKKLLDEIELRLQAEIHLEENARRLKEVNDTKDRFFSIISHDLRSPLAAVQTISAALRNDFDSFDRDSIREYVAHMDTASHNLADLLDNLLSWARLQTGAMEHRPEEVDLHLLGHRLRALLEPTATQKGVSLEIDIPDGTWAWADPNMMNSVGLNLLSNGVKFTAAGGSVTLSAQRRNGRVHVEVRDTGVGMETDDLARLFRIDTAFSTPGTNREPGSGLGLILCQEMISRHGSELSVVSTPMVGTTFAFDVPAGKTEGRAAAAAAD